MQKRSALNPNPPSTLTVHKCTKITRPEGTKSPFFTLLLKKPPTREKNTDFRLFLPVPAIPGRTANGHPRKAGGTTIKYHH